MKLSLRDMKQSEAISSFPLQVLAKKVKFLMFLKELPLVAFLKQETFAVFTPGFSLQSGLLIRCKKEHLQAINL